MKQITRRRFLGGVPAAVASAVAAPMVAALDGAAPPPQQAAGGSALTPATLDASAQVAGLQFTAAERAMALPGVVRNRESFAALRQLDIPLDTPPAFAFRPGAAGRTPAGRSTRNATLAIPRDARPRVTPRLDEVAFEPVTVLSSLIERRQISSTDLTRLYLDRLARYGDALKCVVTRTEAIALAQASRADQDLRAGRYRGPLHGIPWGAKDLLATKGIPTTWGAAPFARQVLDVDATVVERLREAGAVLVAKLSMGSLALGDVWFGGRTRNPWAPASGSSGSSAGLVGFSIGTETRGSIISPSATCGVVGLRPTYGRISRYGAMALSWTMDKIGPICRSVEDSALVLNAIYGEDGRDETVVDAPFAWNPGVPLSSLRIGFVADEFDGASPESMLLSAALEDLKKAGAALQPIELPDFPARALDFILSAEAAAAFDDLTRSGGIDQLTEQGPFSWPNTFRTSRYIPAVEYIRAQRARTLLARRMEALMSRVDVFVSPPTSASLRITNLTGHPAVCVNAGFVGGLPQGLMFTGRLYEEATMLRVALAYERATGWNAQHPSLAALLQG